MVSFYRMLFFSFEKGSNGQNQPSSDSYQPIKKSPPAKLLIPPQLGRFSILLIPPLPLNAIWKTLEDGVAFFLEGGWETINHHLIFLGCDQRNY